MACPTCDYTMQGIGEINREDCQIFWCPRCGTLRYKHRSDGQESDSKPSLPQRTRQLLNTINESNGSVLLDTEIFAMAHRLGVFESCMLPSDRPQ